MEAAYYAEHNNICVIHFYALVSLNSHKRYLTTVCLTWDNGETTSSVTVSKHKDLICLHDKTAIQRNIPGQY